jgi:pilus assembly protein CpaC
VGQSIIVDSPVTIKKIALAAPEIADITVISPRQIYLVGKTPGVTNGTIWGTDGKISAMLNIEVAPDVVRLKERIHEMIPNEKDIKVTASPDGVVLTGTVSNTQNLSQVAALAQAYAPKDKDGKPKVMNLLEVGGVHQVMLEVRVSEMSRTLLRRLGVNFAYDYGGAFGISLLKNLTNLPTSGWPGNPISVGSQGSGRAHTDHHERQDGEFPCGRRISHPGAPGDGCGDNHHHRLQDVWRRFEFYPHRSEQ